MSKNAFRACNAAISTLAETVRWLSPSNMRRLHIACILPIPTYASPVWWTERRWQAKKSEAVLNEALHSICGRYISIPTHVIELDAGVLRGQHRLDLVSAQAAIRRCTVDSPHPLSRRLAPIWHTHHVPSAPIPAPILSTRATPDPHHRTTPNRSHSTTTHTPEAQKVRPPPSKDNGISARVRHRISVIPKDTKITRDNAMNKHKAWYTNMVMDRTSLVVYTDGSQINKDGVHSTGAGAAGFTEGTEIFSKSIALGDNADVFDAEMQGLAEGMAMAAMRNGSAETITLCTDNSLAVESILDVHAHPAQHHSIRFCRTATKFLKADSRHRIVIRWTPGHKGIEGNVRADQLAKQAAVDAASRTPSQSGRRTGHGQSERTSATCELRP